MRHLFVHPTQRHWAIGVILLAILIGGRLQIHHASLAEQRPIKTPVTNHQITRTQQRLQHHLQRYLNHVTADKTTSICFYNLGAVPHSPAAHDRVTKRLYARGQLAVSANADTTTVAASTYKLFVAGYVFQQHRQLNVPWSDAERAGFTQMIVNSANDYAENTLDTDGLAPLNDFIGHYHGQIPTFSEGQTAVTTATSLTRFLINLADRTAPFNHASDQQWLLKLMHQQVYRAGISAGATAANPKAQVADKVGFLSDTNNDAGIITLPNGERYVLVIMTHGHQQAGLSGFPRIAHITTHLQKMLYDPKVVTQLKTT